MLNLSFMDRKGRRKSKEGAERIARAMSEAEWTQKLFFYELSLLTSQRRFAMTKVATLSAMGYFWI